MHHKILVQQMHSIQGRILELGPFQDYRDGSFQYTRIGNVGSDKQKITH